MAATECPYGDESFVVADYLAGRLSETDATAFEAHTFACDRCFEEFECATELRAAAVGAVAPPAGSERSQAAVWSAFALAAAVVLGIGLWIARPPVDLGAPAPDTVYRDGDAAPAAVPLSIDRSGDRVTLAWDPVQGADLYEIYVFNAAGDPVLEERSAATSHQVSAADWQEGARNSQFYLQVIALDELRQTIARSDLQPL